MDSIFGIIELIGSLLTGTIQFLVNLVLDIVYVVQLGVEILTSIPLYFSWLPPSILALLVTFVTVAIILKVAGRR